MRSKESSEVYHLKIVKAIKSGQSAICVSILSPSTSLIQELILFTTPEPEEGAPRIIILCPDN